MADVYYYIKKADLEDALSYGIKLSKNYIEEMNINGSDRKYMIGYLNPKDDMKKYKGREYVPLRFEVRNDYLLIADATLQNTEHFYENIIPIEDYKFGTYQNPIVLIFCSVFSSNIYRINKYIDVPVLYSDSTELYFENTITLLRESTRKWT